MLTRFNRVETLDHLFYTNIINIFEAAYFVNNLITNLEGWGVVEQNRS